MSNYHSIAVKEDKCVGCVVCMKACPTNAIRVKEGKAVILDERCIDCGVCLWACPKQAIIPLTTAYLDLMYKFKYNIAMPSPALYSQFGKDVLPNKILLGLERLGFDYVYDVAWTCEMTTAAIRYYLENLKGQDERRPKISSTCPAVVRLIQVRFPELTDLIIPIDAPRELAAKALKDRISNKLDLSTEEIGVIYITPCPSKMISINNPPTREKSYFDGAIAISDIYGSLLSYLRDLEEDTVLQQSSGVGIGWAVSEGVVNGLGLDNCLAVAGIENVNKMLEDIESYKLKNIEYLECHACPLGCVSGPLTVENQYLAKSKISRLIKMFGEQSRVIDEAILQLWEEGYFSSEKKVAPTPIPPLDREPRVAIEKMKEREEIIKQLEGKECGACGAPDCQTLAEDIVQGKAEITDCVFRLIEKAGVRV
ncbi:MAG: 4Fe-4S dicluster domain-containing protein [Deltaproteobacteria bacterium]|nr:MAG: 4Fe-4S dicluster domain-containing protein [Deltaproteobacteria bacterium]